MKRTASDLVDEPAAKRAKAASLLAGNGIVGIRREDKNRWERRVPLSPAQVGELVKQGLRVLVQPSMLRVFTDEEYVAAGATISEDLSACSLVLAVKEVPTELLLPGRSYAFFSHTIKAQSHNMGLLDTLLAKQIRLFDYERIVDDKNSRLVRFGLYAGMAGMLDYLHCVGNRLLAQQMSTPFLYLGMSYNYDSVEAARVALRRAGALIAQGGLPAAVCPFVVVLTGRGHVTQGALSLLRELPTQELAPAEVATLGKAGVTDAMRRVVFFSVVEASDWVERVGQPGPVSKQHYYAHPGEYRSLFVERFLKHASVVVNGAFWSPGFPRLCSIEDLRRVVEDAQAGGQRPKLIGISDISCDIGGAFEFVRHATTIDEPVFFYDAATGKMSTSVYAPGAMVLSVDHLPCELAREASEFFGNSLLPFVREMATSDGTVPFAEQQLSAPLRTACVTAHGRLTPDYEYIAGLRAEREAKQRRILLLGAGLVVPAVLDYLHRDPLNTITIASLLLDEAVQQARGRSRITAQRLDVSDVAALEQAISGKHVVISLVPAHLHGQVGATCLKLRVHLITASYVSPAIRALHNEAEAAGLLFLNEVGLDPGIDHLSIVAKLHELKQAGGRVTKLVSLAGGLPAPEDSDNTLGYKFSWSPRGALVAALNDAEYRENGALVRVAGGRLLESARPIRILPGLALEVLPNRNSLQYEALYGIEGVGTLMRGTLRFGGYCRVLAGLRDLGLLSPAPSELLGRADHGLTWHGLLGTLLGCAASAGAIEAAVRERLQSHGGDVGGLVLQALEECGMLGRDGEGVVSGTHASVLDGVAAQMGKKMAVGSGERDMIVMHHVFGVEWADGSAEEHTSTLLLYGTPACSAMSATVGLPVAIATQMLLDGEVAQRGVVVPTDHVLATKMLAALAKEGIVFREKKHKA